MIDRYTRPVMAELLGEARKLENWLEVELCACEAMAEEAVVPLARLLRLRDVRQSPRCPELVHN